MLSTAASCPSIYLLIAEYFDERLVMAASSGSGIASNCTVRECGFFCNAFFTRRKKTSIEMKNFHCKI